MCLGLESEATPTIVKEYRVYHRYRNVGETKAAAAENNSRYCSCRRS